MSWSWKNTTYIMRMRGNVGKDVSVWVLRQMSNAIGCRTSHVPSVPFGRCKRDAVLHSQEKNNDVHVQYRDTERIKETSTKLYYSLPEIDQMHPANSDKKKHEHPCIVMTIFSISLHTSRQALQLCKVHVKGFWTCNNFSVDYVYFITLKKLF